MSKCLASVSSNMLILDFNCRTSQKFQYGFMDYNSILGACFMQCFPNLLILIALIVMVNLQSFYLIEHILRILLKLILVGSHKFLSSSKRRNQKYAKKKQYNYLNWINLALYMRKIANRSSCLVAGFCTMSLPKVSCFSVTYHHTHSTFIAITIDGSHIDTNLPKL